MEHFTSRCREGGRQQILTGHHCFDVLPEHRLIRMTSKIQEHVHQETELSSEASNKTGGMMHVISGTHARLHANKFSGNMAVDASKEVNKEYICNDLFGQQNLVSCASVDNSSLQYANFVISQNT